MKRLDEDFDNGQQHPVDVDLERKKAEKEESSCEFCYYNYQAHGVNCRRCDENYSEFKNIETGGVYGNDND